MLNIYSMKKTFKNSVYYYINRKIINRSIIKIINSCSLIIVFVVSVFYAVCAEQSGSCLCHHNSYHLQCVCVCVCVCLCAWARPCVSEVNVLVGQAWTRLLPCVWSTRWPLFLGTACQIHPWKMNSRKALRRPTSTTVKCTTQRKEGGGSVFIRPGRAAGQCSTEVQLFPQSSLTPVKWGKKTLLNNLLCSSSSGVGCVVTWGGRLWIFLKLSGWTALLGAPVR